MRTLIFQLLVMVSLIVGTLSAATAYLAPLSLDDQQLVGLVLHAPAGIAPAVPAENEPSGAASAAASEPSGVVAPRATPQPLAAAGTELTPELLTALRAQGVRWVRSRDFVWSRWSGKWLFLVASVALVVFTRWPLRTSAKARPVGDAASLAKSPVESLRSVELAIDELLSGGGRANLSSSAEQLAACQQLTAKLGVLQQRELAEFVAARQDLLAGRGPRAWVAIMDRFAAGERQLNRSWAAAADGVYEEAVDCLAVARERFQETRHLLETAER